MAVSRTDDTNNTNDPNDINDTNNTNATNKSDGADDAPDDLDNPDKGASSDGSWADVVSDIKRLEKKQLGYAPYSGEIEFSHALELEPREYVDLAYSDLLNLYERSQKIQSALGIGLVSAGVKGPSGSGSGGLGVGVGAAGSITGGAVGGFGETNKATVSGATGASPGTSGVSASAVSVENVESKLKEMTSESLKQAEEVGKSTLPQPPPSTTSTTDQAGGQASPNPLDLAIEFESRSVSSASSTQLPASSTPSVQSKPEKPEKSEKSYGDIEIGPEDNEEKSTKPAAKQSAESGAGIDIDLLEGSKSKPKASDDAGRERVEKEFSQGPQGRGSEKGFNAPGAGALGTVTLTQTQTQTPATPLPGARITAPSVLVATSPPALYDPAAAAASRYEQMEAQVAALLGSATDEVSIKKKMLELTKELFKEKSTNKREQIKMQITILKNLLGAKSGRGGVGSSSAGSSFVGGKKTIEEAHSKLFETLLSAQQAELAQTKDTIIESYHRQILAKKNSFYVDLEAAQDSTKRKQVFEAFVFSVTSLVEQLPNALAGYRDFVIKKHLAEMEKLRTSLDPKEKQSDALVKQRLEQIQKNYSAEFDAVKAIIGREIESMVDSSGRDVFGKGPVEPVGPAGVADAETAAEGTGLGSSSGGGKRPDKGGRASSGGRVAGHSEKAGRLDKAGRYAAGVPTAGGRTGTAVTDNLSDKEDRMYLLVKEINEMGDNSLLNYLNSKDPDTYRKYGRKQIARAEAIATAKVLVAQEKGLSEAMIKKYFGEL